jgi:hypothetical protein
MTKRRKAEQEMLCISIPFQILSTSGSYPWEASRVSSSPSPPGRVQLIQLGLEED